MAMHMAERRQLRVAALTALLIAVVSFEISRRPLQSANGEDEGHYDAHAHAHHTLNAPSLGAIDVLDESVVGHRRVPLRKRFMYSKRRRRLKNRDGEEFDVPASMQNDNSEVEEPPEFEEAQPLPRYSMASVVKVMPYYHDTLGIVVYDPQTDRFVLHYATNMRWISGCYKLVKSFQHAIHAMRLLNPDRFKPDGPEFAFAMSSSDYPGVHMNECVKAQGTKCIQEELAPILHFGSVFRRDIFPSMLAMPMPQNNHLGCFHNWVLHRQVCEYYQPRGPANPSGLIFPEHVGMEWDRLINSIIWRGTDFSFLHKFDPTMRHPDFDMDIEQQVDLSIEKRLAGIQALRQIYDDLVPRWKGVAWTAEAELEVYDMRMLGVPAWCNIKFSAAMSMGKKVPTNDLDIYRRYEEYGIPASGEGMSLEAMAEYKYHIDLGGGGGTTWSGTLEKLGLPGLLFHHMTPTKDYLHDMMIPWFHYVPVREDLSDLKEKYLWAESHPRLARRISENGTKLARTFGSPEGLDAIVKRFFVSPLTRVMDAYQPITDRNGNWHNYLSRNEGEVLRPIISCQALYHHDCEKLADDVSLKVHGVID